MKRSVAIVLIVLLFAACANRSSEPWQGYGGDGTRSLVARERGPVRGRLKWVLDLQGTLPGMPVTDGKGDIYVPHSGGSVTKVSPQGRQLWRFDSWLSQKDAPPPWLLVQPRNHILLSILHQQETFRLTSQGEVVAGTPWLPWPSFRNPAQNQSGYTVVTHKYVTGANSVGVKLYGITTSGNPLWEIDFSTPGIVWSASIAAVKADGTAYVFMAPIGGNYNSLLALDGRGELLWQLDFKAKDTTGVDLALAVGPEGNIYLGSTRQEDLGALHSPGWLFAVSPQGKLLWRYEAGQKVAQIMAAHKRVTINVLRTKLVNLSTQGKKLWEFTLEGWESTAVMDSRGQVYMVGIKEGTVWFRAITPRGREAWTFDSQQPATSVGYLIIANGHLLVTTDQGLLLAIGD